MSTVSLSPSFLPLLGWSAGRRPAWHRWARQMLCGLAWAVGALAPAQAEEEKVLHIYNWSNYIAPDTIANFERETGIKVRYDNFDSNEIVHAKMVAGKTGYDIVVPTSYWARMQLDGGLLQKLDKSRLPNLRHLDPVMQAQMARLDPGNQHMVNWLWGFTTIGINVDKVKAALGDLPMPANVWDLLFKPEYVSRLHRCGVSVLDSATELVPAALHYLGKPAFSREMADYQAVPELLRAIRPYITVFSSSGYINDMAQGSLCMAFGYSGDFNIARFRAEQGRTGQRIETLLPENGGVLFMDVMVIPADAARPGNAHKWINYILRPDVHASLTNKVFFANPNVAARALVRPEVIADPTVYPSEDALRKMARPVVVNNDIRRRMTRIFTTFKTGM